MFSMSFFHIFYAFLIFANVFSKFLTYTQQVLSILQWFCNTCVTSAMLLTSNELPPIYERFHAKLSLYLTESMVMSKWLDSPKWHFDGLEPVSFIFIWKKSLSVPPSNTMFYLISAYWRKWMFILIPLDYLFSLLTWPIMYTYIFPKIDM